MIPGAVVESAYQSAAQKLDTGEPDPDTNMLQGEWRKIVDLRTPDAGAASSDVQIERDSALRR